MTERARTMEISLPPDLDDFVREEMAEAGYSTASDVVRDGLRLLEQKRDAYRRRGAFIREALKGPVARFAAGERGYSLEEVKELMKARRKERLKAMLKEIQEALNDEA